MASKREFKKYVDAVTSSISGEMMTGTCLIDGINADAVQDAVIALVSKAESLKLMSNVKYDKSPKAFPAGGYATAKRAFYKELYSKLNKQFSEAVNATIKAYNEAIPASVKNANKK